MKRIRLGVLSLLALVLLFAVVSDRVSAARAARAEADNPPEGIVVDIDGTPVHAVVRGTGPDLVLIHGAGGSSRDFTFDLLDRLAQDYRVIAFDRPGLGRSGRTDPRYRSVLGTAAEPPEEQAALLAAAASKLGADRPIVAGHSFGGAVALAWALDHDPAAIVLLGGVSMPWPGKLYWTYRVFGSPVGGLLLPMVTAWVPGSRVRAGIAEVFAPQSMPEGYDDHLGPELVIRNEVFLANARQVNSLRPHIVTMSSRYGSLDLPIELLHGRADQSVPLDVHSGPFSRIAPGANLQVLDGVGHMPHHADPDATLAAIDRAARRSGLR